MKVRNDFVTNSSSSSFIIAMKDDMIDLKAKRLYDIILSSKGMGTDKAIIINGNIITGEELLDEGEVLEEAKNLINNNWNIYYKRVDQNDTALINILYDMCKDSKYVKCLEDEY